MGNNLEKAADSVIRDNETKIYLDLSNKPYQTVLPDLSLIDPNVNVLRLAGLYLHDISALSDKKNLRKLNISFTYVTSLPKMDRLEELQMMEIELADYNDLTKFQQLKRLKLTHDNFELIGSIPSLEVLHCAILKRPDLLYKRFPGLKEVRFEHIHPMCIHPMTPDNSDPVAAEFYKKLKYVCCASSKTVICKKDGGEIDDFNDEPNEKTIGFDFVGNFRELAEGRLEFFFSTKNLSKHGYYSDNKMRKEHRMNIYSENKVLIKSFETLSSYRGTIVCEAVSDEIYVKINNHLSKNTIYDTPYESVNTSNNSYTNILKGILYNNYQLNDSTKKLLDAFVPANTESWSIDQLFEDIKQSGMSDKNISYVKFFKRYMDENELLERKKMFDERKNKPSDDTKIVNCNSSEYYDLPSGQLYKNLKPDDIKDVVWFCGKKIRLTPQQKKDLANYFVRRNNEFNGMRKNMIWSKFDNGKEFLFRHDDKGNEVMLTEEEIKEREACHDNCHCHDEVDDNSDDTDSTDSTDSDDDTDSISLDKDTNQELVDLPEINNSMEPMDDSDDTDDDTVTNTIQVQIVPMPGNKYRTDYTPKTDVFNNIFMKDAEIVLDADFKNLDLYDHAEIFSFEKVVPSHTSARYHLNYYGRPANFSKSLIENSNGHIMLGTSGDEGWTILLDALLDKSMDNRSLELLEVFFIFKNRMYTSFLSSDAMRDFTDDVTILKDGRVGWGGTFYPFDVITEPHPKLITNIDICISSPLSRSFFGKNTYKCCDTN